ncbi:hypothetical protein RIR_jg19527.t1 [Rhizophagus irregularis DAOM 181602=DAOM 197198]|nr:hypothetical protein RIR_jg19527.t1 [Rhizophagus irregularis DAOM 181602=DAOM 197198]
MCRYYPFKESFSLDQEPDQLSEDEKANLFIYLTGNDTILVEVKNLCNLWQTNSAKLKYLKGLSKKFALVIVEQPDTVKRTYDQADLADNSAKICGELIQRFETIPTKAEELQSLINRQLLQKWPVTSDEEQIYPEMKDYVYAMIRVPLETFNKYICGALPIEIDQDKADSETTMIGSKQPDFLCWIKKLLLFKGEEKASSSEFNTAVEELKEKFNVLDPICFTKKKPSILSPLTSELNASNLVDRITILCTVVNIARIILIISDNIPNTLIPLGK